MAAVWDKCDLEIRHLEPVDTFGRNLLDQIQLTAEHLEVSVYHAGLISVIEDPIDPVRGFRYGGGH